MPKCVIKKCRNNTLTTKKKDGVTYHRFPVHEIMRENWRKLVARERCEELYKPNKSSVICSDHFLESDLYCTTKGFKRLKKTAVPHIEFVDDSGTSQSRKSLAESSEQLKPPNVLKSTAAEQKQTVLSPRTSNSPVHKSILSSPSGLDSIINTPKTTHFKKELTKFHRKLRFKAPNNEIKSQIVGYISGFVVYQLIKKLQCDDCKNNLLATQKEWFHKLVDLKDMGGLCYASKYVFVINTEAENIIRHYNKLSGGKFMLKKYDQDFLTVKVLKHLLNVNIFTIIDAHTKDQFCHIYDLTKAVIQRYVNVRLHYICQKDTLEKKTKSKRQIFNKLNLFQGT